MSYKSVSAECVTLGSWLQQPSGTLPHPTASVAAVGPGSGVGQLH